MHLDIFGQNMVVISSAKVAKDLLDKKGSIYSDRPQSVRCSTITYSRGKKFTIYYRPLCAIGYIKAVSVVVVTFYPHSQGGINERRCGYSQTFTLQSHNETWRKQRRLVSHDLSVGSIMKYYPLQEKEAATLVRNLLNNPDDLMPEIQMYVLDFFQGLL